MIAMREPSREMRRCTRAVIGSVIVATVAVASVVAVILVHHADGLISHAADQRAQHSLDLLATVGADMPDLRPAVLQRGLSPARQAELQSAIRRGQQDGLLSALSIWNARGELIYPADGRRKEQATRSLVSDLARALRGRTITVTAPAERDLTSPKATGALVAFEPLRDGRGHVYGVLRIDLPLQPILDQTARERRDILIFVIGGAAILWLITLPFTTRAALGIARSWDPGRRRLLSDFRRALDDRAIELVYQPQIDPIDRTVHGFEALVRWRRRGELLSPDRFLAVIESSVLMTDLTDRVIDLATTQLAAWRQSGHTLRVSINLSATDLEDDTLAERLHAALTRHAIPSEQLTVEVTETAILHDIRGAQRVLSRISELGVQVAVDDFGTGHASIRRLHQFPIDEVKIDQTFVIPNDDRTRSYLTAIVRFGQSLGLRVVAEGVEDQQSLTHLGALGCDVVQGYYIAKPLSARQIHDWLSDSARSQPRVMAGEAFWAREPDQGDSGRSSATPPSSTSTRSL
jgi:EAL domain-containing protein (putative c-di-GMP-specific phosphodiesterase class I)